MAHARSLSLSLASLAMIVLALACSSSALAEAPLEDDGGASWRLEQPQPPPPPPGVSESSTPIGLGAIGDIQFWAPNRGLLITAGNGSTIPPGLWAYNGEGWHELSTVCGATDGRIAWAGPDEFWTISDGRPGQANVNGKVPPLADDTLCHFVGGRVAGSYASLAFQASSYQPMHAAACFGPSDCWFGGDPLPEPGVGAFHLVWEGRSVRAEANPQGHATEDMRLFEGRLYESVRIRPAQQPPNPSEEDQLSEPESPSEPSVLHQIAPAGIQPTFTSLLPGFPVYAPGSFPAALSYLRLGADSDSLWGAAGPVRETPGGSAPAETTVVRYSAGQWTQPVGPGSETPGADPYAADAVNAIAAEPGTESAWMALDSQADASSPSPTAPATLARVSADGAIGDSQSLPGEDEAVGNKGAAKQIVCPAPHDCWMATTQGWLFHLAPEGERQLPRDSDPAFDGLITLRPEDEGLPQVAPDAPPADDSGLLGEPPAAALALPEVAPEAETRVPVPLLSKIHTRLVHRTTLELRFHLAVKARVRLLARRKKHVVASTANLTLAAGDRHLTLHLDPRRWPTKLDLQTHALAPLPTTSTRGASVDAVSTSAAFPTALGLPSALLALSYSRPTP
jgi:hypothetical protein